ncbi:hypothetical protein CRG98_044789 [Punica granatum]|nr:hypothetical protein CRG98_044789 [Punica granatum]
MLCQAKIGVRPLSDEEAWTLFARTLGSDVVSPRREPIAKNIVKECGGLPLAIVIMAGSMRGVDSDHGWEGTGIERIPDGVVGKLLKLQVLGMGWIEVKGEEVVKLKKLEVLQCRFRNANELNKYT